MIKQFRDRTKLKQHDIAQALGVRQATISDWENGKSSARDFLAGIRFAMLVLSKGYDLGDLILDYPEEGLRAAEDGGEYQTE